MSGEKHVLFKGALWTSRTYNGLDIQLMEHSAHRANMVCEGFSVGPKQRILVCDSLFRSIDRLHLFSFAKFGLLC